MSMSEGYQSNEFDYAPCILEGHDVSYCQDHNACIAQWEAHDNGEHENCHPDVCEKADKNWLPVLGTTNNFR